MGMKKIILAIAAMAAASCSFLDVEPKVVSLDKYYNTVEDAQNALYGVYGTINSREIYGEMYSVCFSLNDDLSFRSGVSSSDEDKYVHNPSNPRIYDMWWTFYQGINNANCFMEAMEVRPELDPKGEMVAQARFLRAYFHFLLAQAWGDVPLMKKAARSYSQTNVAKTPQADVLAWCVREMKQAAEDYPVEVEGAPSKLSQDAMKGIIARVCLFAAGKTVDCSVEDRTAYLRLADTMCRDVIESGRHTLNPDYTDVFIRYISNVYDTDYRDSMWEADFYGDRAAKGYSNGYIGEINGLYSYTSATLDDSDWVCNIAYARFQNTLLLWDMYMEDDRTPMEKGLAFITDRRQEWNLPPYHYNGRKASEDPMCYPYGGLPGDVRELKGCIDKTPYVQNRQSTNENPLVMPACRYFGTFRREVQYEGVQGHQVATAINYPLLRYSDVLLMYAEVENELNQGPTPAGYDAIKQVRDRAGIATNDYYTYDYAGFQQFVRNERGREIPFESLRKYDLIRWGIFYDRMKAVGISASGDARWDSYRKQYAQTISQNVQPKHVYLPIPTIELGVNKLLKQNPLW